MALAKISFNRGKGGLGRVRAGADHISGLVFYGTAPAGYGTNKVEVFYSVEEAETKGITKAAYPVFHYHISEFFRALPNGQLYVGIFVAPLTTYTFTDEVNEMVRVSQGQIRQLGVYAQTAFASGLVSALHAAVAAYDQESPLSAILTADIAAVTDLTTLPDLRAGNSSKVSVDIGQSGKGTGADLYGSIAKSVGTVGYLVGTIAASDIQESVSHVGKFDISGNELDVLAFGNGNLYSKKQRTELDGLDDKGYVFGVKYPGYAGSFFSSSKTCSTGDYDSIERNRAIDKAVRLVRGAMLPKLNSPVYLNADGTLRQTDVDSYEAIANSALDVMLSAGELSAAEVKINPAQDILSTDKLSISLKIVPVGIARFIEVNLGFTASINA